MKPSMKQSCLTLCVLSVLILAQCRRESDEAAAKSSDLSPDSREQGLSTARRTLRLFTWEDFVSAEVLRKFTRETGIVVEEMPYADTQEVPAKLRSMPGQIDVLVIDDTVLQDIARPLRLVRPIDKSLVPNIANLDPAFLDAAFDPGNEYSLPYALGFQLIAYRKDQIADPGTGWELLWRADLKGKIGLYREANEIYTVALVQLGKSPASREPADIQAATELAEKLTRDQNARFFDDSMMLEKLATGEIWAAPCYQGDAMALMKANPDTIAIHVPDKPTYWYLDSLCIARDSQNADLAHQLINFLLEDENAAACANLWCFRSPNLAAGDQIDPWLAAQFRAHSLPPDPLSHLLPPIDAKTRRLMNAGMSQILRHEK